MTSNNEALDFYRGYGKNTDPGKYADLLKAAPASLEDLCAWVKTQLIHPVEVARYADVLPEGRTREDADFYTVHDMLQELMHRNPQGLTMERKPAERLVLSCRFHAMFLIAAVKHRGIPARVRVGFAGYLSPKSGKHIDHWITQIWNTQEKRWMFVDVDTQRIDLDDFELAGDVWLKTRKGDLNSQNYGFHIWWGPEYIVGNLCHDLYACLNHELIYWEGPELFHRDTKHLNTEELAFVDRLGHLLRHPEENLTTLMKLQVEAPLLQNIRGTAPDL